MLDIARDIIGIQPILDRLSRDRAWLSGRPDQHRRFLARCRRGPVRRARHRRVRAEGADHRADRPDRPDHVSLRHRHPLWAPILRGHDRAPRPEIQSAGVGRASWPDCWSRSDSATIFGIKIGHTLGLFAGSMTSTATLQAALDVMKNKRAIDRLFGRLSVRRDRPDPLHLFHDPGRAAEIPAQGAALPHGRNHARRVFRGSHSRRPRLRSARRRSGDDGPQERPELRADGRSHAGSWRRRSGRFGA